MAKPVSVIIPTYNRARKLKRAIVSVLKQTYKKFEVIVIDDCSQDNTKEVVKNLDDDRIRYIRNEKNLGGSGSRNVGIENAQYDYIAFLDDDDEWLPTKLEKQVKVLNSVGEKYCGVFTGFIYYRNKKRVKEVIPKKEGDLFEELLKRNIIGGASVILIRKTSLDEVGYFNEKLPACQDLELYLRLSQEYQFKSIEEPLTKYHIHSGEQIKDNISKYFSSKKYIYKTFQEDITKNDVLHSTYLYSLAKLGLKNDNKNQSRKYLKKCIRLNSRNIKFYIAYLSTYTSPKLYLVLTNFLNRLISK